MKVVLPFHKKDNAMEDEFFLLRDTTGFLRPAIGKDALDVGQLAASMFGTHGFTDLIGAAHFGGEVVEFHTMTVSQILNSPEHQGLDVQKIALKDLRAMIDAPGSAINLFLNLGIRMYLDKLCE